MNSFYENSGNLYTCIFFEFNFKIFYGTINFDNILIIQGRIKMENKHIQKHRNENDERKDNNKKIENKYIHKNECEKNENNFHKKIHIHDDEYMDEHSQEYVGQQTYQHVHTHVDENGNVHTHAHTHSPQTVKNELNRIARIIGHMKSIKIMIESGRDCSEVLIQLAAVDAAVKSLSRVILKEHMSTCIVDAIKTGDEEPIKALNEAIDKFMK